MTEKRQLIPRERSCLACGNERGNRMVAATEKLHGMGGDFRYLECNFCKSVQLVNVPENMADFYPQNYYAFGKLKQSNGIKNIFKKLRFQLFKSGLLKFGYPDYMDWLSPIRIHKNTSIADIGCGNGQLIYELKCSGYNNLFGFDPYLPEEVSESGFSLQRKDLMEISGEFDVVMLHHSFEHLENPKAAMEKLSHLLGPKGKLLIRVPVTDASVWEEEGTNWFQLDAPRHLFIPSKKAMKLLGEKSGLTLTQVIFDSNEYQFIVTDMYKNDKKPRDFDTEKWGNKKSRAEWVQRAKSLNQKEKGDQACFYFEKG